MDVTLQVFCLLTSMFENRIALLEINVMALLRSQQSKLLVSGREKGLSVVARYKIILFKLKFSLFCYSLNFCLTAQIQFEA